MLRFLFDAWEMLLDVLYPPRCVACGVYDTWLCLACESAIEYDTQPHVIEVGGTNIHGMSLGFYHDPCLRALIHAWKYQRAVCLRQVFRRLVTHWLVIAHPPWAGDSVVFVGIPEDARRARERGHFHIQTLLDAVAPHLSRNSRAQKILHRVKKSSQQNARLPAQYNLRAANVHEAFYVECVPDPNTVYVVFDDVVTTGATMGEALRTLRKAGANKLYWFCLARGSDIKTAHESYLSKLIRQDVSLIQNN